MTESHTDGLQSPAVALLRSPLKRLVIPAVVIFTLVVVAGYFAYFVRGPAPVSQYAALAAPPATQAVPTVGLARETDMLTVVDRLRPSNEDIVKAFRLATEDPGMAQDAFFVTHQRAIAGPIPLPKRRPPPRP
jgi:hypothetical protein